MDFKTFFEQVGLKIWLDDERDPNNSFIQQHFGSQAGMTWVKSAAAAINLLQHKKIDFISFDHDLGEGDGTGLQVATWIEEKAFFGEIPPLDWTVHSQNPVGRKDIIRAMKNAERFWKEPHGNNQR